MRSVVRRPFHNNSSHVRFPRVGQSVEKHSWQEVIDDARHLRFVAGRNGKGIVNNNDAESNGWSWETDDPVEVIFDCQI